MSWFMREINNTTGRIRVCLLDGRLLVGTVAGIEGNDILRLSSGSDVIDIDEELIADYIQV